MLSLTLCQVGDIRERGHWRPKRKEGSVRLEPRAPKGLSSTQSKYISLTIPNGRETGCQRDVRVTGSLIRDTHYDHWTERARRAVGVFKGGFVESKNTLNFMTI